ncbi:MULTISPECIES: ABC transporter permease subunit [unclassified Microbacterium]|uniref:ABC transporter permease subunit n=1 Tax=unclassified Microbacterium TaxID=2609290 RepID=UPI00214ACA5B|nr:MULTISPECIES: ABC transporter permease subunit [unclassified Microbacterium]MCR2784298.1 ABC transporter permease subunit [Microbacterium sp. zg.B96]WIM14874.1 ABC transporter permease subunit [Microbacterium sp. zg-B96]
MIDRRRVWAVIRKDWLEISRDKQVIAPLVIIPLLFAAVIPSAVLLLGNTSVPTSTIGGLQSFIGNLPPGIVPAGFSAEQTVAYAVIVYFMAPFFLLIPVMIASITASSSLVGEKERRTIEGLLYSPLSTRELVLAKVLGSVIPAVVLTWVAFLLYATIVNTLGAPMMGGVFFPTWTWAVIVVILVPLVGFLATSLIVAVSAHSSTMQGAQGTAMFVVLPILALVIGQSTGLMLFDVTVALITAAVLLVVDVVAFVLVVARFDRERIVTRL